MATELQGSNHKRRLWMIISITLGLSIIIAIVVPITIISLRKTATTSLTTMNMNASFTTTSVVIVTATATKPTSLKIFRRTNEVVAYTNHGICDAWSYHSTECGLKTGFYLTFKSKSFVLMHFRMATNKNSRERDPVTITIEGSNNNESELTLRNSWTLIYNGSSGLQSISKRQSFGETQTLIDNVLPFASYRFLTTSKGGESTCVSYSELRMMGQYPDENV
ncbi:hypothetical protein I4U23_022893 [Adineta vaga]|nr:hypothetical protein I4U23_022893 [Adineta vaga]